MVTDACRCCVLQSIHWQKLQTFSLFSPSAHKPCQLCRLQSYRWVSVHLLRSGKILVQLPMSVSQGINYLWMFTRTNCLKMTAMNRTKPSWPFRIVFFLFVCLFFFCQDGRVLLWDKRKPNKPATRLGEGRIWATTLLCLSGSSPNTPPL